MKRKNLIAFGLGAFLALLGGAALANEAAPRYILSARLSQSQIDEKLGQGFSGTGWVQIDLSRKLVRLVLEKKFKCAAGAVCAQVMPKSFEVVLPLAEHRKTSCNIELFIARTAKNERTGFWQEIQVRDTSQARCRDDSVRPTVQAEFRTVGSPSATTRSFFAGHEAFERLR